MDRIFVPDPVHVWLPGEVVKDDGNDVAVKLSDFSVDGAQNSSAIRLFARDVALTFPHQVSTNTCQSNKLDTKFYPLCYVRQTWLKTDPKICANLIV